MNTFLAIYKRQHFDINASVFSDYLIDNPTDTKIWKSKDNRVLFIGYTIRPKAKTQNFVSDQNSALTFEGFPLLEIHEQESHSYESGILNTFKQYGAETFSKIRGEYCAVAYTDGELHIGANLGGSHGLYYTVNDHLVAFSNRSPLLLKLPHVSNTLDTQSSAWKCYQGYISGTGTPFKEIRKVPIGSTFTIDSRLNVEERKTTYQDLNQNTIREKFEANPLKEYEKHFDDICDYMHRFKQRYPDLKFHVPLSGGKDSRLILSFLLKAGLQDDIQSVWTHGPLYSPEVVSSQEVCKQLRLPPPDIRRPSVVTTTNVSAHLIINTQNLLEGNLSIYDFQGLGNENCITMQGHQIALRDGAFTKCRTDRLEYFLEDAVNARMHDPLNILNQEYYDKTQHKFKGIFSHYHLEEGAPLYDLGDLYYLRDRLLNWASPYCNAQYYSGPMSNPLLLGDLFNFSFSIPYKLRSHEIFHYLGMRHCAPECLNVPFANQEWNPDIANTLKNIGIDESFQPSPSFKSHRDFPNVANPYVASLKVEYFNALKGCMTDLANKHQKNLSEFMNVKKFTTQIKDIVAPNFRELYCGQGVYSDLIIREYGADIFNRKNRTDVIKDLENRITRPLAVAVNKTDEHKTNKAYEDIIEKHEKSIASFVREGQSHEEIIRTVKKETFEKKIITRNFLPTDPIEKDKPSANKAKRLTPLLNIFKAKK